MATLHGTTGLFNPSYITYHYSSAPNSQHMPPANPVKAGRLPGFVDTIVQDLRKVKTSSVTDARIATVAYFVIRQILGNVDEDILNKCEKVSLCAEPGLVRVLAISKVVKSAYSLRSIDYGRPLLYLEKLYPAIYSFATELRSDWFYSPRWLAIVDRVLRSPSDFSEDHSVVNMIHLANLLHMYHDDSVPESVHIFRRSLLDKETTAHRLYPSVAAALRSYALLYDKTFLASVFPYCPIFSFFPVEVLVASSFSTTMSKNITETIRKFPFSYTTAHVGVVRDNVGHCIGFTDDLQTYEPSFTGHIVRLLDNNMLTMP